MRPILGLLVFMGFGLTTAASAQQAVKFDSRSLFSCPEVKPPQQADVARKVVVIVIPVSADFRAEESTVELLHHEFRFPKSVTILDHYPKTQTGTDIAGLTEEQRREHHIADLNVKFEGEGKVGFSLWGVGVNVGGGASRVKRDLNEVETNIRSAHLPPRGQVVVAGREDDGRTLYFDLKWFNQITRAGLTDYAFLAEVPKDWSGDVVTLACTARQGGAVAGRLTKVVGLYLGGDNAARQRVEKLLETARPAVPQEKELVTNSIGTRLKLIPAGSFLRGATPDDNGSDDEKPQRKVTITRPYYLGVYEVTQYEYRQVMNDNPSKFKGSELLPVEQVSWLDAVKFCNKLSVSEREGRKPYYKIEGDSVTILGGNGYRLPTEAEWEYACRAPQNSETATKYPFGNDDEELLSYAWFDKNSENKTHPVGQKKPNRWGLYDMQGNVWEWCQDWYSADYYRFAPEKDPPGPASTSGRVFRGGSWGYLSRYCRPAFRYGLEPASRAISLGFRLAADQQ